MEGKENLKLKYEAKKEASGVHTDKSIYEFK